MKSKYIFVNLKKIITGKWYFNKIFYFFLNFLNRYQFKLYIDMVESTMKIINDEIDKGKTLMEMQDADILKDWNKWGTFFTIINKNTWINNVYLSYTEQ